MDKFFSRIFELAFGSVGLVFLTVGLYTLHSEIEFRKGAVRAPGTIVDLLPERGSKGGTLYKPVFEFADASDREHRVTARIGSSPPSYERGEAVTVLYRPGNPEAAQLDSFIDSWFLPLVFGGR